jgi:hypothetical protein
MLIIWMIIQKYHTGVMPILKVPYIEFHSDNHPKGSDSKKHCPCQSNLKAGGQRESCQSTKKVGKKLPFCGKAAGRQKSVWQKSV